MGIREDVLAKYMDLILQTYWTEERQEGSFRYFKARLILRDGSSLNISEVWQQQVLIKYRYYWLDRKSKTIIGWDNAPHHPELENFPHHKHINEKEIASYETCLESVRFAHQRLRLMVMEVIRKLLQSQ